MKTNYQAPKGAHGLFWAVVILMAVTSLFIAFRATKHANGDSVKVVQAPTAIPALPPNRPHHLVQPSIPQTNLVSDVAPETEAALAQFGLSATNLVKIAVVAQSRPPVILPNPMNKKMQ
jgi:hypothetical protein